MSRIRLIEGDITSVNVDIMVNAANSRLVGGGGVDGAFHRVGGPSILEECAAWVRANGRLPPGEAMMTRAGDLPAIGVIHTVGPIWGRYDVQTAHALLASCYRVSLDLATGVGARSIAFPNIATGVYGFPKWLAAAIAVGSVRKWNASMPDALDDVLFVCFNAENSLIYSELVDGWSSSPG